LLSAADPGRARGEMAATQGAKVLLAEESRVGGTCVIRGCVPKKLMVLASRVGMEMRTVEVRMDLRCRQVSWPDLKSNVDAELDVSSTRTRRH